MMRGKDVSSDDESLLWGMSFFAREVADWVERYGREDAEAIARRVLPKICWTHALALDTAWGGW